MIRVGVVTFPGTCDDRDAQRAVQICGGEAVALWHADTDLSGVDAVILPGGFSYGDYLRCGAIAALSPLVGVIRRFADAGGPVLGICNGFQVLCEAGLLPGVLRANHHGRFVCRDVDLVVEHATPWTGAREPGSTLRIPVKHGEGAWYVPADEEQRLTDTGQVLLRYAENVNGATGNVAGIQNAHGNVFGMMPHPEHAVDATLGSTDGRTIITAAITLAEQAATASR
jgi:phosphoribosylformylglycinamidine synthase subunit PurQ / glutaminase